MVNPNPSSSLLFQRKAIGLIVCGIILCLAGIALVITGGIRQKRGSEYTSSIISGGILSLTGLIILIAGAMLYSKAVETNQRPSRNPRTCIHTGGTAMDIPVSEELENSEPPKYDYPPRYEDIFPSGPINLNISCNLQIETIQIASQDNNTSAVLDKPEDYVGLNNNKYISSSSEHHTNQVNNIRDTTINVPESNNQSNPSSILEQIEAFFSQVTSESHIQIPQTSNRRRY